MTRNDYIIERNRGNDGWIMYQYYLEHLNRSKNRNILPIDEFFKYIQLWEGLNNAAQVSLSYYDSKFNIIVIPNKQGDIIRYE